MATKTLLLSETSFIVINFQNYKHVGKKPACLLFFLEKTNRDKPAWYIQKYTLTCGVTPEWKGLVSLKKLGGGGKREKEEVNIMKIWKFIEINGFLRFYFLTQIVISTGELQQLLDQNPTLPDISFPKMASSGEVYNHVLTRSTADRTSPEQSLSHHWIS